MTAVNGAQVGPVVFARILVVLTAALLFVCAPVTAQTETGDMIPAVSAETQPYPTLDPLLLDPEITPTELDRRLVPLTREELSQLAQEWQQVVRSKTDEVMAAEIELEAANGDAKEQLRPRLADLMLDRNALFDRFSLVLASWERKAAGKEEDLARIAEYRAYRDAVTLDEIRTSEFKTIVEEAKSWLTEPEGGVAFALTAAIVLASLAALFLFGRLVKAGVHRALGRFEGLSSLMRRSLANAAFWLVMFAGVIVALSMVGMDITPLFALIGAASFIFAFAFQETLGNLASGFMIILNRPFDEGDTVEIDGVSGIVRSVSLVATKIVTFDNQVILVPNRNVWGTIIKNLTASDTRRVDLVFGISYSDSVEEATEVLESVTQSHPAVLSEPKPVIRMHELADSSVNFICRPWVRTEDYWTVYWDLTQQVKQAFDARGISIPFPQQDLHLHVRQQDAIEVLQPNEE